MRKLCATAAHRKNEEESAQVVVIYWPQKPSLVIMILGYCAKYYSGRKYNLRTFNIVQFLSALNDNEVKYELLINRDWSIMVFVLIVAFLNESPCLSKPKCF